MNIFVVLVGILLIFPQNSIQQNISESALIVTGICEYSYNHEGRYSCLLHNARVVDPQEVLVIVGIHLPGHLDEHVQSVSLNNVTMRHFNGEILQKFINLRFLFTFNHGIEFIHENAFEVCGSLQELVMRNNFVSNFPSQMLRNCGNLRSFDAQLSRRLQSFPDDFFGGTRSLEVFTVSGDNFERIPDNLLQNMTNLRVFNIQDSKLRQLSANNFINANNLQDINLSSNLFDDPQVIMNALNGLTSIRRIIITSNPNTMINFQFFSQFINLEELSIDGGLNQNMTLISWQFLPPSLVTLRVTRIGENIPESAFHRLSNLQTLELRGFGITTLERDTFRMSTNLQQLTIADTNLRILDPQLFAAPTSIRTLNLVRNQIEELPEGIFRNLVNLGHSNWMDSLQLTSNNIHWLSINAFGNHPLLTAIHFNNNEIMGIERGLFSRFNRTIMIADFRNNSCVNEEFWWPRELDTDPRLDACFRAFELDQMPPTNEPESTTITTTPDACGRCFNKTEVFWIILFGIFVAILK